MDYQHDSCVLIVGGQVVVRADAGPLEAEYALFHPDCIELRTTEPGAVREAGYRTTAFEARARLADAGVTPQLAETAAATVRPHLATWYARGPVVRRAVAELGAAEMFDGRTFVSATRAYEGRWLDVANFTAGFEDPPELARALQAMHLAALLTEVPDDADVYLATLCLTQSQRPGVRTFRRVTLGDVAKWPLLLAEAGATRAAPSMREAGPTRVEVLDWLSARKQNALSSARERAERIERSLATTPQPPPRLSSRVPPSRGPLSDPVAWSIEAQLDAGEANAALARIDMMERAGGSSPCVVYLRSRASLMLKREDPQVIAERISTLAASASFDELELLAAQAWAAAGNLSRALPYARVLASNPQAADELRSRAKQLVDVAQSARPPTFERSEGLPAAGPRARTGMPARGPSGKRTTAAVPSPPMREAVPARATVPLQPVPQQEASGIVRRASPLPAVLAVGDVSSGPTTPRVASSAPAAPRRNERDIATMPPPSPAELDNPALDSHADIESVSGDDRTLAKGVSRPAFRAVTTNTTPPQLALGRPEIAECFDDPNPPATLADIRVRAAYEARLHCTAMARELGMLYRTQHGVELRNDVASLEAIQAELVGRYHDTGVRTVAAMIDLRRHGAFLSEMIARTLRATWLDVSPKELGHWTMFVPPDTRVWPFARVLRFVTMGSKERDLVAYFLELHARSC